MEGRPGSSGVEKMATAVKAKSAAKSTAKSAGKSQSTSNGSNGASESIHVIPHSEGWAVRVGNRTRAHRVFKTKNEAEQAGRDMATRWKTELVIQTSDGKISQKDSHGHDPHPP